MSVGLIASTTHVMVDGRASVPDRDNLKGITTGRCGAPSATKRAPVHVYTSTGKRDAQRPGEIGTGEMLALRVGPVVAKCVEPSDSSFKRYDRRDRCNVHPRRYFVKALDANDARAAVPIAALRALYDIEHGVREASTEERAGARRQEATPVYEDLVKWRDLHQRVEPPKSLLGVAIRCSLNHKVALVRYLDDGTLPIDKLSSVFVAARGGEPWLPFAGSHVAGERAAIAYSVLATCRLLGIDPTAYLSAPGP